MLNNLHEGEPNGVDNKLPSSRFLLDKGLPPEVDPEIESIIADITVVQSAAERQENLSATYDLNGARTIAADNLIAPEQTLTEYFDANTRRFQGGFPTKAKLLERLILPPDRVLFQIPAQQLGETMEQREDILQKTGDEQLMANAFISFAHFTPGKNFRMRLGTNMNGVSYNLEITPPGGHDNAASITEYLDIRVSVNTLIHRAFPGEGEPDGL